MQFTHMRVMAAAALIVAVIAFCQAGEQQDRRFPLELEVLARNAARLLSPSYSSRYKQGLRLRMQGTLGYLPFLAREYLQAKHQPERRLIFRISRLRQLFTEGQWQVFARDCRLLSHDYPFSMVGLEPEHASEKAITAGRHIYRHLCLGCHEHPDTTQAVPAPDLYRMARTESPRELIARLITGVHGTPAVALRNPFSNAEIAGLAAYLRLHDKASQP